MSSSSLSRILLRFEAYSDLLKNVPGLMVIFASALAPACTKSIGDSCQTALDCSIRGDRICDTSQNKGYCTVRGCDMNACPDDALCVQFRPKPERLSENWCMASCDDDSDCRDDENYRCKRASELPDGLASVIDIGKEEKSFCVSQ